MALNNIQNNMKYFVTNITTFTKKRIDTAINVWYNQRVD